MTTTGSLASPAERFRASASAATVVNGMKLISGSSRPRPARRFTVELLLLALAVRELDQLDRLLFHLQDQAVDLSAEMAVEDHARDGDDQAECGVIQGHRNAVR